MSFGGMYYPAPGFGSRPRLQSTHPFRHLVAAGSNMNNQWSGASGHSGYGADTSDYDYHSGPSAHVPSGGSYSYHATGGGSGYGPPPAAAVHHPPKPALSTGGGDKKGILSGGKRGSSAISALTLLSFLFFINLLQSCIKDHMDAMNPTVMVMTTNIIRNRFNKMGEMNSREQSSGTYASNAANIVMQPADLLAAAGAQQTAVMEASMPSVSLQSPYSSNAVSYNKPVSQAVPQPPVQYTHNTPEPEVPINYAKPQYDTHKPDPYNQLTHLPPPPQSLSYNNHTLVAQSPPIYKLPAQEQQYNYHHTEYNAQPPPQSSAAVSQYGISQNPFYEHQQPVTAKPYNGDVISENGGIHHDYNYRQKYEMPQQQPVSSNSNNHPWSSNLQTSSVQSEPFRRASIISVSPKSKWISVPAKITDRTHFVANVGDATEEFEHHDDRDVFHSRFN